jgi:hypothetical protein
MLDTAKFNLSPMNSSNFTIKKGSRLVKPMRTCYQANDDKAKPVFSAFPNFGEAISAVVAAVLSGYGSH